MSLLPPLISSPKPLLSLQQNPPKSHETKLTKKIQNCNTFYNKKAISVLMAGGFALSTSLFMDIGSADAVEFVGSSLAYMEPANALSLPTWAIHVSSVAEWVTAMILVWQYGEKSGYKSWKGLSWGMVPLLGGAFCACTWHFFYNAESLEILVALQGALTVIGNTTMCIAAYRIYKLSQKRSTDS
uniref:Ycf49-like protein n=1 Tax=Tanacetum cinerariifolium TaxID=118510 RepID=A0A6L2JIS8_TANCI|nr:ycf49-like protein [Tanacetum cinerariifolium]